MQKFLEVDNGNPDGTAKDAIVGVSPGTNYKSKVWNDNLFNLFKFVESQGYALIDDDLSQISKASKALYNPEFIYNTSALATQTVNDIVLGSDGVYYEADADGINADDPVGSITGKWKVANFVNSNRIDTLTDLRAIKIPQLIVYVTGHTVANDSAFGSLYWAWNPTSTDADNNTTIIKLTSITTGRYELQYSELVNARWGGAVGDGSDETAIFTALATVADVIEVPKTSTSYQINAALVNASTTFLFYGDKTQVTGTVTAQQLKALFTDNGYIGGIPIADGLRDESIGIVAGTIRQNAVTPTQWDYISDTGHAPVGVSGAFATAAGGSITINYDKTYTKVISFSAAPDETLANTLGFTVGASVGASLAVLSASSFRQGAFTVGFNGATWDFASGTGQDINPTDDSYSNGTLVVSHDYCRGSFVSPAPFSANGAVNPYLPIIKNVGNDTMELQWIDTTTGLIVTGVASTRMKALVTKANNGGLFLDGTNNSDTLNLDAGNIWFMGIFQI